MHPPYEPLEMTPYFTKGLEEARRAGALGHATHIVTRRGPGAISLATSPDILRVEVSMLLTTDRLDRMDREVFERGTGWALRPEGACRGGVCIPLSEGAVRAGTVDVEQVAERLGMPIARHSDTLASLGPATFGGTALSTAEDAQLILPDLDGQPFDLTSLRGSKVALVAWSPY